MKKTGTLVTLGTGIIALIVILSNYNIKLSMDKKEDSVSVNQQVSPAVQESQDDSMASMHGGAAPGANAAVFNSLIGTIAPDFTLETYDGDKITLSSLKGNSVILFFNEGLMCYPSCWNQIVAFGKDAELGKKAVLLSITADPKNDWKSALDKMPELAQATVLFDSNRQVSAKYGVLTLPSSMHKGQFPGHSYVIVDKNGIVKFVQDDVQMAVRNKELSSEIDKL
ncbi:MAG: hypothetical protein A3H17_01720 [Candidatus Levybacteria bacterium RIFCSPLOWO2_12_FULL_37_14]|nr:MAG: Thiolspecific antioxidant protein [Candidatus Levybacteria bacterium GW2011_GWA1_37_16]KKQ38358.1 MAG: Thiolspecific antioxidant protein [Candidatus Levybacteria bacterium GW2011_GWC2_37_7]KKQ42783.1 MAG: Thiolspecific antioxidant protein [Candidatus Levybacteria bacterium GW2011_GWB1_37_8]OGH51115.1 MAG: hypothetical protein A3H17_01720 [Candidatus Levybacteria bacterium RIFCSPLOWO2_12_FULL_37_14]